MDGQGMPKLHRENSHSFEEQLTEIENVPFVRPKHRGKRKNYHDVVKELGCKAENEKQLESNSKQSINRQNVGETHTKRRRGRPPGIRKQFGNHGTDDSHKSKEGIIQNNSNSRSPEGKNGSDLVEPKDLVKNACSEIVKEVNKDRENERLMAVSASLSHLATEPLINHCLQRHYRLKTSNWSCSSKTALRLLKKKYNSLKLVFYKEVVLCLDRLNEASTVSLLTGSCHSSSEGMEETKEICTSTDNVQETVTVPKDTEEADSVNGFYNSLVDPRVMSLSKTLQSNRIGKVGEEKIFRSGKSKKHIKEKITTQTKSIKKRSMPDWVKLKDRLKEMNSRLVAQRKDHLLLENHVNSISDLREKALVPVNSISSFRIPRKPHKHSADKSESGKIPRRVSVDEVSNVNKSDTRKCSWRLERCKSEGNIRALSFDQKPRVMSGSFDVHDSETVSNYCNTDSVEKNGIPTQERAYLGYAFKASKYQFSLIPREASFEDYVIDGYTKEIKPDSPLDISMDFSTEEQCNNTQGNEFQELQAEAVKCENTVNINKNLKENTDIHQDVNITHESDAKENNILIDIGKEGTDVTAEASEIETVIDTQKPCENSKSIHGMSKTESAHEDTIVETKGTLLKGYKSKHLPGEITKEKRGESLIDIMESEHKDSSRNNKVLSKGSSADHCFESANEGLPDLDQVDELLTKEDEYDSPPVLELEQLTYNEQGSEHTNEENIKGRLDSSVVEINQGRADEPFVHTEREINDKSFVSVKNNLTSFVKEIASLAKGNSMIHICKGSSENLQGRKNDSAAGVKMLHDSSEPKSKKSGEVLVITEKNTKKVCTLAGSSVTNHCERKADENLRKNCTEEMQSHKVNLACKTADVQSCDNDGKPGTNIFEKFKAYQNDVEITVKYLTEDEKSSGNSNETNGSELGIKQALGKNLESAETCENEHNDVGLNDHNKLMGNNEPLAVNAVEIVQNVSGVSKGKKSMPYEQSPTDNLRNELESDILASDEKNDNVQEKSQLNSCLDMEPENDKTTVTCNRTNNVLGISNSMNDANFEDTKYEQSKSKHEDNNFPGEKDSLPLTLTHTKNAEKRETEHSFESKSETVRKESKNAVKELGTKEKENKVGVKLKRSKWIPKGGLENKKKAAAVKGKTIQ